MTRDPLVSLLADLVSIPSMNPMGRPRTGPEYSEAAIADYVEAYLRRHGIDGERDECAPGRPNVIGHVAVGSGTTLLLEAHLDTVHADGMTVPAFSPEVRAGRMYGRGACDTKGSLAAFLHALGQTITAGKKPRCNVVFAAVADEEYQFTGAQRAVTRKLNADCGIAGEPTGLTIVRAHKGVTRWTIVTQGVAAHSAYPERGDNAIYTMGHVVTRLEDYALELRAASPHPVLGPPSLSVGVIEGGQAVNVVPDRCTIEVDRRTLPGESTENVLAPVRRLLAEVPGWRFEAPHLAVAGIDVPPGSPIIRWLGESITRERGSVVVDAAHYATDAGVYNAAGIPTVVFGPGDIAQAHTEDESIALDELYAASAIIQDLLLSDCWAP